jgi:site-specific DNA-methyltransferase (adenine-specific)
VIESRISLYNADCLEILASLPPDSIDAVVSDPPYGISFMGKKWDSSNNIVFTPDVWASILRVLKPGGHMVAFSGTRTYHRMVCAIEDAGFEVRDQLAWVFGSGFPKSQDVSKAIDKQAGAEREIVSITPRSGNPINTFAEGQTNLRPWQERQRQEYGGLVDIKTAPATDAAKQWQGWGSALKPAYEPIVLARKPLSEGTIAANVLRWGTGALNIDATRIEGQPRTTHKDGNFRTKNGGQTMNEGFGLGERPAPSARWPANLCHDGSDEVLAGFPETKSGFKNGGAYSRETGVHEGGQRMDGEACYADSGSAARFFYCAKANKTDRAGSKHPTVKPVALMRWLVRMVTPPGGVVLDPFAGTGTTGQAAFTEGFRAVLIEMDAEYVSDIVRRFSSLDETVSPTLSSSPIME